MKYNIEKQKINIEIPAVKDGKLRFKTRKGADQFGKIFSTRKAGFGVDSYLEWQIGYDATKKDIKSKKKETMLAKYTFVGANGQSKSPYELAELLYLAVQINLVEIVDLKNLLGEISDYKTFLGDNEIEVEQLGSVSLYNLEFKKASIRLPTFFLAGTADGVQIEVSIQKQQYASGVQPMLYLTIPLSSFKNGSDFHNRASEKGEVLVYEINKDNAGLLLLIFKVFAMCSPSHRHDVEEILKILIAG